MTKRILHLRVRRSQFDVPAMKGGATVLLTGDHTSGITVQVAYCNPADVFCKKVGREYAEHAYATVVPLRALPGVLGKIQAQVMKRSHVSDYGRTNFDSKIRDFLPKV
jgi:hypothetical protein